MQRRQFNAWLPTGEFRCSTQYAGARNQSEAIEEQEWSGSWAFTRSVA